MKRSLLHIAGGFVAILLAAGLAACGSDDSVETETGTEDTVESVANTESPTESETVSETETTTETESEAVVYYVCTDPSDPEGTAFRGASDTLEGAKSTCDRLAHLGYRVVTSTGENAYLPYTELQCDILRESKRITDFVRENNFKYGDAPTNPAVNYRARKVSCDRFVAWALYNVGFTDQPRTQGVVVSRMAAWCEANGFERIDREEDLQPGDVVLVKFNGTYPAHTFIYAGPAKGGLSYRYDCGSDTRIQSNQPSTEGIVQFWRAYRAVADSPHRKAEGEYKVLPLD